MSYDTRTKRATPPTPAAGKVTRFTDTDGRDKKIDENGLITVFDSVAFPRNEMINGGYNFAQRQVAGTLTSRTPGTAARQYGFDRWFVCNEANDIQSQQIDTITAPETGLQHRYYAKYKKITAVGKILEGQIMTAENMAPFRGRRVRFHRWMKRTVAGSMTVRLGLAQLTAAGTHDTVPGYAAGAPSGTFVSAWNGASVDPTLGTNVSRLTPVAGSADGGTIVGSGLNCVLTGAWVRYSACFDVPSDAKNLIVMVWSDAQLAVNDELNCAQNVLTDGVEIQDWVSMPQVYELDRCSRFYAKSFALQTAPAQNTGLSGSWRGNAAQAGAVSFVHGFIEFAVQMRAAPTITLYNPAAANAFLRYPITPSDATATSATQVTERGTEVTATGLAAWVAGGGVAIHWQADAEL